MFREDQAAGRCGCAQKASHRPSPLAYSAFSAPTRSDPATPQRIPAPFSRPCSTLQPASVGPLPTSPPLAR
jgi:hypothetical protein